MVAHRSVISPPPHSYIPSSPLLYPLLPTPTFPPLHSYIPSSPLLHSLLPTPTFPPLHSYIPSSPLLHSLLPTPTFPPPHSYIPPPHSYIPPPHSYIFLSTHPFPPPTPFPPPHSYRKWTISLQTLISLLLKLGTQLGCFARALVPSISSSMVCIWSNFPVLFLRVSMAWWTCMVSV